jgi:outer membrane protein OmpA-like peptidoglycan-associated protein
LLALLLVPLLLAALLAGLRGGDIETDLKDRSLSDLKAKGIDADGIDLDFDGRDATLKAAAGAGLSKADLDKAKDVVADVEGVRVADVDTAGLAGAGSGDEPSEEPPAEDPTDEATDEATDEPTEEPTDAPTEEPTEEPAACDVAAVQRQLALILADDYIQFGKGKGDLSGSGATKVGKVGPLLAPCTEATVTVTGYADLYGKDGQLPILRARAVEKALVDAGVSDEIITSTAGGEGEFDDRNRNRYATIEIG